MRNSQYIGPFVALSSKHNIPYVNINIVIYVPVLDFFNQTGICAFFGPIGSLPRATSKTFFAGRSGANSINIPAAKSSARASMISSSSCMSFLREFAILFSRVSLKVLSCPLCSVDKYSIILRSISSAVAGFRIGQGSPLLAPAGMRGGMKRDSGLYHDCP